MPRVLLLLSRTSYRAEALLAAARGLGVDVVVGSDHRPAWAAWAGDRLLELDFGDPERAAEAIAAFARRVPLDAVLAAEDAGALVAAHAAAALGLAHHPADAVAAARHKDATRARLAAAGLPQPRTWLLTVDDDARAAAGRVSYPCVLKPVCLSASRGVIRVDDPDGFVAAFERIRRLLAGPDVVATCGPAARRILAETYVPGAEVAVEGLVTRGRVRVLAIFDKPDPLEGPYFEETLYVTPSRLPAGVQARIAAVAARAVAALGLRHGPIHAELRIPDGRPWVLEVAPRPIGGRCGDALRFGDGSVTLEELLLRHALGDREAELLEREPAAAGVLMVPVPRAGRLRAVRGVEDALRVAGIEAYVPGIPIGGRVVPWPEGHRYLGFLFARAATPDEVERALREAHRRVEFEIEPE